MSISLIQHAANEHNVSSGVATAVLSASSPVPWAPSSAHHLIVVQAFAYDNTPFSTDTFTISDDVGNTYIPLFSDSCNYTGNITGIWYVKDSKANARTITVTASQSGVIVVRATEWSGLDLANPLDSYIPQGCGIDLTYKPSWIIPNSDSACFITTYTNAVANELLLAFIRTGQANAAATITPNSPWTTIDFRNNANSAFLASANHYRILSSIAAQTYSGTITNSDFPIMLMVGFKAESQAIVGHASGIATVSGTLSGGAGGGGGGSFSYVGTRYGVNSRYAGSIHIGYPLIPNAPTAVLDPVYAAPAITVILPQVMDDVWGVEIRSGDNNLVLYHTDLSSSGFSLNYVDVGNINTTVTYFVYTYNLLGEYSSPFILSGTIQPLALNISLTVDATGTAVGNTIPTTVLAIQNRSVSTAAPSDGQLLTWVSSTAKWTPLAAATVGTVTSVTFTGDGTVLSSTPSAAVTSSGTLTATLANAAAGTVLGNATSSSATPTYTSSPVLGKNATTNGTLGLANGGGSGATVTIQNLGATSTYNFNLPTTAGTAGYLLTSQGGGSTSMTWTAPGSGGVGTVTSVTFTGDGTVLSSTPSSAVTTSGTLTATLANAGAGTVLGNATGSSAAPTYTSSPVLGVNATTTGTLGLANGGGSGATATIKNLGATAAYNFNLPTTAGTAGQFLTSQGGGSTSMTWSDASSVGIGTVVGNEVPSGSINGSNVTFTLAHTPNPPTSLILTVAGQVQAQGSGLDYTISGATITMATAPLTGENLLAWYIYGPSAFGTLVTFADNEVPSGSINSSNVTFTLVHTANPAASLLLFLNGVLQQQGSSKDYTISGTTITMVTAPSTGDILIAYYRY